jgi:hypothetical protein
MEDNAAMKCSIRNLVMVLTLAVVSAVSSGDEVERQMNVQQGPETVFDAAPEQIFPELAGSAATGQNGRVGNELVFWGYRLSDGREAYLVACAMLDQVDCLDRERRVCLTGSEVLARGTNQGIVRELSCRSIATVGAGDIRPGCSDTEAPHELAVSLLTCN